MMSGLEAPLVVKLGGAAIEQAAACLDDVAVLHGQGRRLVLVHGGGPELTRWQEQLGAKASFVDGLRVSDAATVEAASMLWRGRIAPSLVAALDERGVAAVALAGCDGGLLRGTREAADPLGAVARRPVADGRVVESLWEAGMLPVVTPLAAGEGETLNVNADTAAAALAAYWPGSTLVLLTDVEGVLDPSGALVSRADEVTLRGWVTSCVISRGMLPKVEAALEVASRGGMAVIAPAARLHPLTDALRPDGSGTRIKAPAPETPEAGQPEEDLPGWAHALDDAYLPVFRRQPVAIVRGRGAWVEDAAGRPYLDLLGGLAVNLLGHAHPKVTAAIRAQAATLQHSSNLYYHPTQAALATRLSRLAQGRVFLTNSGSESIEGALKLARRWGARKRDGAHRIIAAEGSFHGRTLGALSVTGKAAYREGWGPLPEGVDFVPYNDLAALKAATGARTVAVLLEPVQGEGGVYPAHPGYLAGVREWCDAQGLLLVLDEVQTAWRRTGHLFAHQGYGVRPDIMALAKGLGGGLPIGALVASEEVAACVGPGDHGSTFGGNPVACAAALAVLDELERPELESAVWARVAEIETWRLDLLEKHGSVTETRQAGLMLGIDLRISAPAVVDAARRAGVLVNSTGPHTLRLLPPLTIQPEELASGLAALEAALAGVAAHEEALAK